MTYIFGFSFAILFMMGATYVVDLIIKAPTYKGPKSDHFDGKKFINPGNIKARGLLDVLKWTMNKNSGPWQTIRQEQVATATALPPSVSDGKISITFVNHTTFLIQVDGINILTDPIWSLRASPFQWTGPKRMRPPGIRFKDLPPIDLVLLSHNHYDHLDIHTVKKLSKKYDPLFITPLGVSKYLQKNGVLNTAELDWWQENKPSEALKISAVPAQHFSGRGLSDRDKTLWAGYVVETTTGNIYFAGDTGYNDFFKEIGRRFNSIDVSLIPVGAYRPRWFMSPIHVDPEQAVNIHQDVGSKQSIGSHFGTFALADDGMTEPAEDLAKAREKYQVAEDEFFVLKEGGTFICKPEAGALKQAGE